MLRLLRFTLKEMFYRVGEHNLTAYSAQMAYFFLLSIFPFLILVFALLGKLDITSMVMSSAYMQFMPAEAYSIIDAYIKHLLDANLEAVLPVSLLASLWTASKAVNSLERALNTAYEVEQPRKYWIGRFLGMVITILFMIIMIGALTLPSMGRSFIQAMEVHFDLSPLLVYFLYYGRWTLLILIFVLILGLIHTILPNKKMKPLQVAPGILLTFLGWIGLSLGFSAFLKYFTNISFVYGSLGAVITLMIWLYFVGILVMLGGELNAIILKWQNNRE